MVRTGVFQAPNKSSILLRPTMKTNVQSTIKGAHKNSKTHIVFGRNTACGAYLPNWYATTIWLQDISKIDCKNCQRTWAFKKMKNG